MIVVDAKGPLLGALKGITVNRRIHYKDKKEGHQTLHEKPRLSLVSEGHRVEAIR